MEHYSCIWCGAVLDNPDHGGMAQHSPGECAQRQVQRLREEIEAWKETFRTFVPRLIVQSEDKLRAESMERVTAMAALLREHIDQALINGEKRFHRMEASAKRCDSMAADLRSEWRGEIMAVMKMPASSSPSACGSCAQSPGCCDSNAPGGTEKSVEDCWRDIATSPTVDGEATPLSIYWAAIECGGTQPDAIQSVWDHAQCDARVRMGMILNRNLGRVTEMIRRDWKSGVLCGRVEELLDYVRSLQFEDDKGGEDF
jgi:hypothetical protein